MVSRNSQGFGSWQQTNVCWNFALDGCPVILVILLLIKEDFPNAALR